MSRFKHALMGSVLVVGLIAVPAASASARQAPTPTPTSTTALASAGMATPDGLVGCGGCWG